MYLSQGFCPGEVGDFDLIVHDDRLHLFHLCLPSHHTIAHLVTDDGIHWEALPHALHVGDPGSFDDDQLWTMHTFRWDGRFHMLYTALSRAEGGLVQRTGLAVSDDLVRWEKAAHNPVAEPDPRWYEADTTDSGRADWRDPFAWVEGGRIHALVCAHEKEGPHNRRGCVGYFTSGDGENWQVQPPFYSPRTSSDFECPALFKLEGRYYLTGHLCAPSIDVYRVAERLEGPWRRPADDRLLPAGNVIFNAVRWRGRTLVFHCIDGRFDWPNPRRVVGPAHATRAIAPPKEAVALPNGDLTLRSCDAVWEAAAQPTPLPTPSLAEMLPGVYRGDWEVRGAALHGRCATGLGVACWPEDYADFSLEFGVEPGDACECGVAWRSDETADRCTRVVLMPGRRRVELQRLLGSPPAEPARVGRGHQALQDQHYTPATRHRVRVVAYGPYVEVSVDGRVLLTSLTMSRRSGRLGFFVSDGSAVFMEPRLTALRPPEGFGEDVLLPHKESGTDA